MSRVGAARVEVGRRINYSSSRRGLGEAGLAWSRIQFAVPPRDFRDLLAASEALR